MLPSPLSDEETSYLFSAIEDPKNREKLIIHNMRLALKSAKYIALKHPGKEEDIYEVAIHGLIKAIDTYDQKKYVKFTTYATRCILNEVFMFLRGERKNNSKNLLSLEQNVFEKDKSQKNILLEEILFIDDKNFDNIINKELCEYMYKCINELKERDKQFVILYFGFGNCDRLSQRKIAELYGVSPSYVSNRIKCSLKKIKQKLLIYDQDMKKTYVRHIR